MKKIRAFAVLTVAMLFMLCACRKTEMEQNTGSQTGSTSEWAENMVNTKDKSVTSTGTQNDADSNGKVLSVTGWSGLFCLFGGKEPESGKLFR